MADMVNHPPHYQGNGLEAIEVIEAYDLGYHLGNALKYLIRAGRKGSELEDLKKAKWYVARWQDTRAMYTAHWPKRVARDLPSRVPVVEAFGLTGARALAVEELLDGAVSVSLYSKAPIHFVCAVSKALYSIDRAIAELETAG